MIMSKSDPKTAAEWAEYSRSGHAPSLEDCFAGAMEPSSIGGFITQFMIDGVRLMIS